MDKNTALESLWNGIKSASAVFTPVPKSALGGIAAFGAGWYGRSVTLTYGPSVVTAGCVLVANKALGTFAGYYVGTAIALTIMPAVIPPASIAAGIAAAYVATVAGNALYQMASHPENIKTAKEMASDFVKLPLPSISEAVSNVKDNLLPSSDLNRLTMATAA